MARQSFLSLAAALAVGLVHAEVPVPAVWFKADTGVTADPSGNVTKWANQGSLGSDLDLTPAAKTGASTTALTVAEDATFGTVVHFDGTDFLTAAVESAYGLTTAGGATFVAVINSAKPDNDNHPHPAIFGHRTTDGSTPYFGLYFNTRTNSKKGSFLAYFFGDGPEFGIGALGRGIVSATAFDASYAYLNGGYASDGKPSAGAAMGAVRSGVFRLGLDFADTHGVFLGDFAEFRLYDRALTAAERFQAEGEMAAKYGLTLRPSNAADAADAISPTTLSGCTADACAFGDAPNGGKSVAAVPCSGTSGGLTATFGGTPATDASTLVYLANNGASDADKVWCVAGAAGAHAVPLTLTFALDASMAEGVPVLYVRAGANDVWTRVAQTSVQDATLTVALPTGWQNAQYAVRDASVVTPAVWFKADTGVTADASGNVTKWANQGSLGADLDLTPAAKTGASATALTVAEDATFGTVVHFDGTDFLTAAKESTYGLATAGGVTFVAVINSAKPDHDNHPHPAIFGHRTTDGAAPYFGLYYNTRQQDKKGSFLPYFFGEGPEFGVGALGRCVVSATASDSSYGYLNGGYDSSVKARGAGMGTVRSGVFRLGLDFTDTHGVYLGDFAEFRLYDHALTAAERFQAEGEMAAKYGFALRPSNAADATDAIAADVLAGCSVGACAFGDAPNGGLAVADIPAWGRSGGLTASFGGTPATDVSTLVYLANNGASGADKVWCVAGAAGARAVPLTLRFEGVDAGLNLYRSADGSGTWTKVAASTDGGVIVCSLPAGWENARYRFFAETTALIPTTWFCADRGVTLAEDKVVGWTNGGSMGSVLDLAAANGERGVTVVQNAQFGTSLHFDGTHYLRQASETATTLGVRDGVGATIFLVCDYGSTAIENNLASFGLVQEDGADAYPFGLYFNKGGKYLVLNFFNAANEYCFCKASDKILGRKILSITASPSLVSGKSQSAFVNGTLSVNADKPERIVGAWTKDTVALGAGRLALGFGCFATHNALTGDIAEFRVYDRPLTSAEQAAVELELAAKYGFALQTVGAFDAEAVSGHPADGEVIGAEAYRGSTAGVPMKTVWSDGTLSFSFVTEPPAVTTETQVKSLTYLGSNGAEASFAARTGGSSSQDMSRTWYIASACPSYGANLEFACDMADAAEWKYRLDRKAKGAAGFARVDAEAVVGDGKVTFTLDSIGEGVYRLSRRPANCGMAIIIR